jgi:hypothetical protein
LTTTTREPGGPAGWSFRTVAMVLATAQTADRSASPWSDCGVPTAMKISRADWTADARSVVKLSRPSRLFRWTNSSSPGS